MHEIIFETTNFSKRFGDVTAVNNVNLKVCKGQVFGFLDPNVAGKTTTIGVAARCHAPRRIAPQILHSKSCVISTTELSYFRRHTLFLPRVQRARTLI